MKSKANYSTLMVKPETKKEIIAMRTGLNPNTSLHGFVQEMVEFYKKGHCPECTQENVTFNACTCNKSERL
jgi:hypothetical protein